MTDTTSVVVRGGVRGRKRDPITMPEEDRYSHLENQLMGLREELKKHTSLVEPAKDAEINLSAGFYIFFKMVASKCINRSSSVCVFPSVSINLFQKCVFEFKRERSRRNNV